MSAAWTLEMDVMVIEHFGKVPASELAEILHVRLDHLRYRAGVLGVGLKASSIPVDELKSRILEMHDAGKTESQMYAEFGGEVWIDRIRYVRKQLGLIPVHQAKRNFWNDWKKSLGWP